MITIRYLFVKWFSYCRSRFGKIRTTSALFVADAIPHKAVLLSPFKRRKFEFKKNKIIKFKYARVLNNKAAASLYNLCLYWKSKRYITRFTRIKLNNIINNDQQTGKQVDNLKEGPNNRSGVRIRWSRSRGPPWGLRSRLLRWLGEQRRRFEEQPEADGRTWARCRPEEPGRFSSLDWRFSRRICVRWRRVCRWSWSTWTPDPGCRRSGGY